MSPELGTIVQRRRCTARAATLRAAGGGIACAGARWPS
eukprot:COSAG06_NODE_3848_length_4835_cov_2.255490_8_plen_37_part_01